MATWTNITKNTATWANPNRNTSSWAGISKSMAYDSLFLMEDSGYILLEDGARLVLESSGLGPITWSLTNRN